MSDDQSPRRQGAEGANAGYAALGYLMSGIGLWGFLGWLLDRWLGLPHIGLMLGLVVGTALAVYLIVKRLGA
ncbi:AtpZ/AtpI family protein [Planosporangium thailandense]|uniref:AtpZ/AtpI family protein n=1 Tax=Planosporangium thailandense TaxID=765197 RepID=A0ABX0Y5E6_9ACTN|nr:AtpZ/AtpI family protein [Planosporangium thailandense]NJC73357.1 AtpZ/AtpI family protein [Planosporangium thailandense]